MQVVGYDTGVRADGTVGPARLLVSRADDGSGSDGSWVDGNEADGNVAEYTAVVSAIELEPGSDLSYSLGDRRCAGTIHDGRHIACDTDAAPYCEVHTDVWVCARCTGTCLKDEMDCTDEHAVYLAAFAPDRFKVGVTRLWRLETRLTEQGADRGAHIRTAPDGRIARRIESELAESADLVDRIRVPTKVPSLSNPVDCGAWTRLLDRFDVIRRFEFEYGLDLNDQPLRETIASGRVVGTKGRLMVLRREGTNYAVDLRDLVGHELVAERSSRDLQSSLGSFE